VQGSKACRTASVKKIKIKIKNKTLLRQDENGQETEDKTKSNSTGRLQELVWPQQILNLLTSWPFLNLDTSWYVADPGKVT
jgi:hypothetical protein